MSSVGIAKLRALWASWTGRDGSVATQSRPFVFDTAIFLLSLAVFWWVVPFGGFATIIGDNIAQVGYWRILFDQAFVGSVAASSMKPGLILLLGGAHDLSLVLFQSAVLIKLVFALAGAGLATIVARITHPVGGPLAGIAAVIYMMTRTPVPEMFVEGTSMIVFLPLLLWGVWLFSRKRDIAGAVVLSLAALIRIEAFAVLLWLALSEQLFKRRVRAFLVSSVVVAVAVLVTVAVYYRVQGSVARFNAGGPPVGYLFAREPNPWHRLLGTLRYTATSSFEMLFEVCGFPYFGFPALLGLALGRSRRFYLSLLGIPLFLIVYIATGQGNTEVRYFQFLVPVTAAFGPSGLVQAFRAGGHFHKRVPVWLWLVAGLAPVASFALGAPVPLCSLSLLLIAASLGALLEKLPFSVAPILPKLGWATLFAGVSVHALKFGTWPPAHGPSVFTRDAQDQVKGHHIPRGQRVLTEDDLIYGVLVQDKGLFREARALQYFNLQNDARRTEMLGSTDYIVVAKHKFRYYYLRYDPLARGNSDPFREAIVSARKNKSVSLYGFVLTPKEVSRNWIVIKVEPERDAS